jgi:hypothetical protein
MQVAEKHHTDWNQARDWLAAAAWPALLLVICIGFFWKLVLSDQYTWLDNPAIANQVLPSYQFQAGEWHARRMPLWDPYLWGGQPLLGQAQPGAAYPLNWLLFLAPLRNGWIRQSCLHWYFVLVHFQAALFCYWLCRDLKRSQAASLLSGLAFGLGGFMGTTTFPQMLNAAVWTPLIFLFFLRAMRGQRSVASAAWSGAFLGIAFLSGYLQIPIDVCLGLGTAWLYYFILDPALRRPRFKLLLTFCLFLILVSGFQILPAIEYGKLVIRPAGALHPAGWQPIPYFLYQVVSLTLALLGAIASWDNRVTRLLAALAVGGLLFSRAPGAIFIFHFGICILIAYGIDDYRSVSDAVKKRVAMVLCSFSAAVAFLIWILYTTRTPTEPRLGIVVLVGFFLAAILNAWAHDRITERTAVVTLTLVTLLEFGNVTTYDYQARAEVKSLLTNLSEHSDIAMFLSYHIGPVRAEIDANEILYNFGDWYGIDHFGSGLASITANVSRIQDSTRARMMYGTAFQVSRAPKRPDQVEVFTSHSGLKVYENPGAFPRAWIVHEVATVQRDDQIGAALDAANLDPRRQTFIKGAAPQLQDCPADETVSLVARQSGRRVVLEANLKCRGMVIEGDTFFPGWVATVDGKPSPIYEAYGFLRGVVVEAGSHRIEMRYRPKSVYWGAALTALGLLGACLLTIVKPRTLPA